MFKLQVMINKLPSRSSCFGTLINTDLVHEGVAPSVPIGPGTADQPAVVVIPAFAPVSSLDDGDQARGSVAHFHLAVFAGSPEHR